MTPEQGIADAAIWCPTAENLSEEEATQKRQDTQGERKDRERKTRPPRDHRDSQRSHMRF